MIILYPVKPEADLSAQAVQRALFSRQSKIRSAAALAVAVCLMEIGATPALARRWLGIPPTAYRKQLAGRGGKTSGVGTAWLEFSPVNRLHANIFLGQWWQYCDLPRSLRLLEAWLQYLQTDLMKHSKKPLTINRAMRLIETWERREDFGLRWAECRKCGEPGLALFHEIKYTCPLCSGAIAVSDRLRGKSGRKPKE